MRIIKNAVAGTMESSDLMVIVAPSEEGLDIQLQSPVKKQFGESICRSVREVAEALEVRNAAISIEDHGALDCTIRARVETALLRAAKED